MSSHFSDHRVYAQLSRLLEFQLYAKDFDFLPKQAIHSILSGRHASRMRGRGLSFEELRAYQLGDDIRNLDWKVTNRTRKPHVRVYSEERERDVLLLVDQRPNMFFGSSEFMKSVIAAELAALSAWRVLSVKDRVGALVFNDDSIEMLKPRRSNKAVMQILHQIVRLNHQLSAEHDTRTPEVQNQAPQQLNRVLRDAEQLCGHDCLVVLISDMYGFSEEIIACIKRIKAHNDFILCMVSDPFERDLPAKSQMIVSDGRLQIQVDTNKIAQDFAAAYAKKIELLQSELSKYGVPIMFANTMQPAHQQLRAALGQTRRTVSSRSAS